MPSLSARSCLVSIATLLFLVIPASTASAASGSGSEAVVPRWEADEYRRFDFWIGAWEVNLRIRQADGSWQDSKEAEARIYRILDGKAILELWDEKIEGAGIRGFSLRYFDPAREKWILYLNWPRPNFSQTGSLEGAFRHGRGEFFSSFKNAQGEERMSRYTFSDITPTSLRWDDAFSGDGGLTWSHNWIMEFTRKAATARWPREGERAHTYYDGSRCDLPGFRIFEALDGMHKGKMRIHGGGEEPVETGATLRGIKVLDGCAVLSFLQYEEGGEPVKEFGFSTFQTGVKLLEQTLLDNREGTVARQLYGSAEGDPLSLESREGAETGERYTWILGEDGAIELRVEEQNDAGSWELAREGFFGKLGSPATR